jgi:signal transduction histidine kinase
LAERHWDSVLLSKIAHDVRGPAGVASSALVELERALAPDGGGAMGIGAPAPERLVAITRRSLKRLMLLSDRLSLLAALDRGEALSPVGVDLAGLCRDVVSKVGEVYARRPAALRVEVAPELGAATVRATANASWIGAALADALMLVCSVAEEVVVRVDGGNPQPALRVVAVGSALSAELLAQAWQKGGKGEERAAFIAVRLVEAVMQRHGGSVSVERLSDGGALVLRWSSERASAAVG